MRDLFCFFKDIPMSSSHPLVLNAVFWVTFATVFAQFSEAIKHIFLARYFDQQQIGVITLLWAIHVGVRVFSDIGYESALIQQKDDDFEKAVHTSFLTAMIRGIVLCVLLIGLSGFLSEYYQVKQLKSLLMVSSFLFVLMSFKNLFFLNFNRQVQLKKPKILNSVANIADLTVTVLVALYFKSIWAVVVGAFVYHITDVVGTHVLSEKRVSFFKFDREMFRKLFHFGKHIQIISILTYLITQLDRFVIGKMVSLEQVAVYATAYFLANLPATYLMQITNQIAYPLWSKAVLNGDVEARNQMFLITFKFTSLISGLMAVILYIMGDHCILLIYGEKWLGSYEILKILVFFGLIRAIASNFGILFKSIGRPDFITSEIFLKLISICLLIYPMTLSFGTKGVAWAITLPFIIITPFALHYYLKLAQLNSITLVKSLLHPLISIVIVVILSMGMRHLLKAYQIQQVWLNGLGLPVVLLYIGILIGIQIDQDLKNHPILKKLLFFKSASSKDE